MTFAALIAGIRAMDDEIARLRAHVATLTAAPATTTEPGLDLDARVPCASCGGEFEWIECPSDADVPQSYDGRCDCGVEWCYMPAPVTWRTLATSGAEVPAAYVARLVDEVDRLHHHGSPKPDAPGVPVTPGIDLDAIRARLDATSPGPWWIESGGEDDTCILIDSNNRQIAEFPFYAPFRHEGNEAFIAHAMSDVADLLGEVYRQRALLTASAPSSTAAPHSGAEPTVEAGAFAGRRALPSAEATDYPVWIIVSGKYRDRYHAGPWFSREAATEHLVACRHRYPRGAIVYCHTGHMSADYRHLCETGTLPPTSGEVSDE